MKKHFISSRLVLLSVIASLLIFLIVSCDPVLNSPNNSGNCPYEIATDYRTSADFGIPETQPDSKYVYVLLDQSYDYKFTPQDIELVISEIVSNTFPGDRLVIAWINLEHGTQTIIFDERIEQEKLPKFPPTFTLPPITPTLTPSNITTVQGQQIQTNEAIDKNNAVINEKHFCEIGEWNAKSQEIADEWKEEQKKEVDSFVEQAKSQLTPSIAKKTSGGKLLYESLSTASQMLQSAMLKKQHEKYILIVFSDMNDWRIEKPDDLTINFSGVDVLVISQNCKYEIDCSVKNEWESQLTQFGVPVPLFVVKEDGIPETIFGYLSTIP